MCRLLVEMLMPLLATGLYSKHGGATVQNAVYVTSAPQLSNHPMTVEVLGGGFSFNPDLDSHVWVQLFLTNGPCQSIRTAHMPEQLE